jgi:hypothetical protein
MPRGKKPAEPADDAKTPTPGDLTAGETAAEPPKPKKPETEAKAVVTYDGTAVDHSFEPAVSKIGKDGKPMKRRYLKDPVPMPTKINPYRLWDLVFPEGEPVELVSDAQIAGQLTVRDLVKKCKALGCFEVVIVDEDAMKEPAKRARQRRHPERFK